MNDIMDEQAQVFWDNCKERICRCNEKINDGTGNKARLMRTLEFCYKSLVLHPSQPDFQLI